MTQKEKVYIAGKITGDMFYREKFHKAQKKLEAAGFVVANPAILPEGFTWEEYMRMTNAMLQECNAVCFLPDWRESKGAKCEYEEASAKGMRIFYFEEWESEIRAKNNGQEKR